MATRTALSDSDVARALALERDGQFVESVVPCWEVELEFSGADPFDTWMGHRVAWLHESGAPFRYRTNVMDYLSVHMTIEPKSTATFYFDTIRPLTGVFNPDAEKHAALFKLFWS